MRFENFLVVSIVVLLFSQTFAFYLIYTKTTELSETIKNTEIELDEKIRLSSNELQNKINSLTDSLSSVSSVQTDLKKQLGELKASTSADFSGVIEENAKGVVTIKTDVSQGTGFLIKDNGFIITNAHILSGAKFANIYTFDNNKYSAKLVGFDSEMDIALLKIDGSFFSLALGNSDDVKVGEKVIAIGNPLGLSFTVTEGIISSRDRKGINNLPYYFQTDVSLNPGNSGGPLINTKGEVIGINNFKISGAEALGFALEINYVKETANEIALSALNQTIV